MLNIRSIKLNNTLRERKNEENALPKSENWLTKQALVETLTANIYL